MNPDAFEDFADYLTALAVELDRYADVPDDVLEDIVRRDGSCMWLYSSGSAPEWTGDDLSDRELAAVICAGCAAKLACLELELRTAGPFTLGVWGALSEDDRRALYAIWSARRTARNGGEQR
ncbi:WhiB family transcriptional regulator [Amycolatopsis thermophila]|uniref:WhiB family redox-sensing transcriptional regulator n=1 Tax=Amycolatopsis thermophila TaxID=206084 RepID=A0ABU0EW68_9PSEU|nr:WhiB family transcriptional regulator [Amycolatopsis thermophila]MDQ0379057.1 WhiB family redox-sensing transcriptional regulator [Amycolatopsis thermophila]